MTYYEREMRTARDAGDAEQMRADRSKPQQQGRRLATRCPGHWKRKTVVHWCRGAAKPWQKQLRIHSRWPCWWYLLGYPIWTKIAMIGKTNMALRLSKAKFVNEDIIFDENTQLPSERDYSIAIFFICFGVLSAVAGVASNIYVLLHDRKLVTYCDYVGYN